MAAPYFGDIRLGDTIDIKFTTVDPSTGIATTGASLAVVAYPGNSTTEITAGITTTFTSGFDNVAGLVNVRIVATSGNGYATATNYALVLSAGTVSSVSMIGYCVGHFSIENRGGDWVAPTVVEAYAADGAAASPGQLLYMIWSALSEFAISGTTVTAKKLDGSTTAMTYTLDDATNPTSRTRAT